MNTVKILGACNAKLSIKYHQLRAPYSSVSRAFDLRSRGTWIKTGPGQLVVGLNHAKPVPSKGRCTGSNNTAHRMVTPNFPVWDK